jgi:hypothetical protein
MRFDYQADVAVNIRIQPGRRQLGGQYMNGEVENAIDR